MAITVRDKTTGVLIPISKHIRTIVNKENSERTKIRNKIRGTKHDRSDC